MATARIFVVVGHHAPRTGINKSLLLLWFAVLCGLVPAHADALTSKEGILFQRDGNIWIMDTDGRHQRQLTKHLVGHVSASRDGRVVFDRFDPIRRLADRNLYYMALVRDGAITRLTHDNESITPAISPDGRTVVYQKFEWAGKSTWEGSGKGVWLMDLASGRDEALVGVAPVPPDMKRQRNALFARAQGGSLDDTRWRYDGDLLWSPDSRQLLFSRTYVHGGMVTFRVDVGERRHVVALPDTFGPKVLDQRGTETLHFDNGSFSLLRYDARTRISSRLADKVFVYQAKYSPDGTKIATLVTDQRANLPSLWILQTSGTDRRAISVSARAGDLSWSPDGRKILFARYYADQADIWIVHTDGSNLKKLAAFVGEAIIRTFGGAWVEKEGEWCVQVNEAIWACPFAKVAKQFKNGPKESVAGYFTLIPTLRHCRGSMSQARRSKQHLQGSCREPFLELVYARQHSRLCNSRSSRSCLGRDDLMP